MNLISKFSTEENSFHFKELQVKHLKTLYKCLIGNVIEPEIVFINLIKILQDITSLSKNELNSLTVLDCFLLLLEIRCTSIGNVIYVQPQDKQNTKIEINLYKFIETLNNFKKQNILQADLFKNIEVTYTLPTLKNIYNLFNLSFDKTYLFFIKKIKINEISFNFQELTEIDKTKIFEQLPIKVTSSFYKKINIFLESINKINLLHNIPGLKDKFLPFNFNIQTLTELIKVLFGEQLMLLYENIFMLCKLGNFTPEYIENCTPGEYILFVKKLNSILNQNNDPKNATEEFFNPINNDLV